MKNSAMRLGFIGVVLCLLAAVAPRAAAAESLAAGVDFLAQDAAAFLADVPNGRFAVLQFVEEPADPSQPLQQPAETAGLGIQLSQLLTESLQKLGKSPVNRPLLCEILRRNQFRVEDLGKPERIRALFGGGELGAVLYGRMRRNGGVITVGIDAVKTGSGLDVTFLPQGRNITIGMNGSMYALCGMNGTLQPAPGVVVTPPGQVQTAESPMVITGPLHPQAPTPPAQPYNIEVLVNGAALPCYRNGNNDFYVPAAVNQAYQVRLTNNTDQTVATALLIDGLGAIGKQRALPSLAARYTDMPAVEAPADVYKFVVQPRSNVVVPGWQIDGRVAREFVFVPAERSVAGERDFWDYIGGISAAFYPVLGQPQQPAQQITRSVADGSKALPSVGTGQGAAFENRTAEVSTVYDRNPAAVMGLFYEQMHVISAAGMTLVR